MLCCFWLVCKLRFFFLTPRVVGWFFLQHYCLTPLLVPLVASWLFLLGLDFYFVNVQLLFCCCSTSLVIFGFFLFYCLVPFVMLFGFLRCCLILAVVLFGWFCYFWLLHKMFLKVLFLRYQFEEVDICEQWLP